MAASALQSAAPDGYTLLVFPISQHASVPTMTANVSYDPVKGNKPISLLFSIATLVAVPADSPINSLAELKKVAAAKSGGLNVGSPGLGTPGSSLWGQAHERDERSRSVCALPRRSPDDD